MSEGKMQAHAAILPGCDTILGCDAFFLDLF